MADTVKKSRIVSDNVLSECGFGAEEPPLSEPEGASLQDIINQEFNQRLKHCLHDEKHVETIENGHYDNAVTITDVDDINDGQNAQSSSPQQVEDADDSKPATARDRMFLSTDSACILFTQTVLQSPMLTPTEDTYDFLQGVTENNAITVENQEIINNENSTNGVGAPENGNFCDEISDENEVCNKLESSDENISNISTSLHDIKEVTNNFIEIEKAVCSEEVEDNNLCENQVIGDESFQKLDQDVIVLDESANENDLLEYSVIFTHEIIDLTNEIEENDSNIVENIGETIVIDSECEEKDISIIVLDQQIENNPLLSESDIIQAIDDILKDGVENDEQFEFIKNEEFCTNKDDIKIVITESQDEVIDENFDENLVPSAVRNEIESSVECEQNGVELEQIGVELEKNSVELEQIGVELEKNVAPEQENNEISSENCDLVKNFEDSEGTQLTNTSVCLNIVSTTVKSESSFVETTTESNSNQDKALKKKKSKKSKKDHEKENISVCDDNITNNEDSLSHVSVKNLCRSFSDLSDVGSRFDETRAFSHLRHMRTKSLSDIRRTIRMGKMENVFGHVSVKALRECFDNYVTNQTNNMAAYRSNQYHSNVSKNGINSNGSQRIQRLKSSFSKFDALAKKTVLHVRSSDSGKAQEKFNGSTPVDKSNCKSCGKQVFQMEQMKAEKAVWHKNCFRCHECNKQLNVDTYQSNEGVLYCKPHFKALFAPKVVEEDQPFRARKHELIIRENQPEELPPDVVRASDKPDLGLDELQNLNVKERFQVFEHHDTNDQSLERTPSTVNVKRSPSILSKLAKFQSKGMDIGVADDSLNGVPVENSASETEEEEDDIEGEDADLIRAKRAQREKPLHFNNMSDIMSKWESAGHQHTREERREERKQEIQSIRSRLFMGKQGKMKEMYQQAVADSESGVSGRKQQQRDKMDAEVCERNRAIKETFERGEPLAGDEQQRLHELEEDRGVFETGITKKSRSIFLELDANASKAPHMSQPALSPSASTAATDVRRAREAFMNRTISEDVVKASDQVADVCVETADITNRFKFFEKYREPEKHRKQFRITPPRDGQVKMSSPEREVYRDPDIIRSEEHEDDSEVPLRSHTATKMLSIFRQMEENSTKDQTPSGPKPLKRFTPPPEPTRPSDSEDDDDEESEEEEDEDVVDESGRGRAVDEELLEAQKAARAKQLRAKFEKWEANELKREQNCSSVNLTEELGETGESQIESAKSLRARFESMRQQSNEKERAPRVKVHRFVDTTNNVEMCKSCEGRVYPLEKVACHNNVYHKNCFRCRECNTILRMDSYTYNQGLLYCVPHFKRLFIANGNYETGFGLDQPKGKWNAVA